MSKTDSMTAKPDPWRVPVLVAQIPETGLHRDIAAEQPVREAMAGLAGLREVLSASASLDVMPERGGRFHVAGRVRARIGQTCVVTLEPIENDIDEKIDLMFAPPEQVPDLSELVDDAAESDVPIPDPPEPSRASGVYRCRYHDSLRGRERALSVQRERPASADGRRCHRHCPLPVRVRLPRPADACHKAR